MQTIGERLRHARQTAHERRTSDRRVTQEDLARAAGVSREALSMLERGSSRSMRQANVLTIADYLVVNPKWLVSGEGDMGGSAPASLLKEEELLSGNPDWWKEFVPAIHALTGQVMSAHKDGLPVDPLIRLLISQCRSFLTNK